MTLREDFLSLADDLRGLRGPEGEDLAGFDIQTIKMKVVSRAWSGGRLGAGVLVETLLTQLLERYKMRHVTAREVAGSGGRYEMEDIRVAPITPARILNVTAATNATPIVVTTDEPHDLDSGATVIVAGALGNTAANGKRTVTVVDAVTLSLDGSVGNGAYTGSGKIQVCGYTTAQLKPDGVQGAGIFYVLEGAQTGDHQLVELHAERPFRYEVTLRRVRTTP